MSLVEPLLPKTEDQKLENYCNDPLANLENSIKKLSVEFESFEIDGTSDIEFRDSDSQKEVEFYGDLWKSRDIKCTSTFASKLVIGRIDGIIKIYDLDTKEEIALKGHTNAVNCLQVSNNEDFLVSGSRDKTIIIWNLETYKQERIFHADSEIFCLVVTSGNEIFSGSLSEGIITKWDFYDETKSSTLSGHEDGITCMKSSNDNHFLVTGSMDRSLRIWSIKDSQEFKVFNDLNGTIDQICITEDNKYIISALYQKEIIILDLNKLETGQEIIWSFEKTTILDVNVANWAIWNKFENDCWFLYFWSIETKSYKEITCNATAIICSKTRDLVFYGQDDNTVCILDAETGDTVIDLKDFDSKIYKMQIVGGIDEYLASIMENGKIKIYEIYNEKIQEEDFVIDYEIKSNGVKLSRDGKYLILFNSSSLKIWNLIEMEDAFSYENINLFDVQISYDANYFDFNDSSIIYLYSFDDMKEVAKFDVETKNMPFCFTFSKDNSFIICGKFDGTIVAFDIENKSKTSTLEGGNSQIVSLQINETNEYLISQDKDQNLIFWNFLEKRIIKSFHFDKNIFVLQINDKYNYVVVGIDHWLEIWDFQNQIKISKLEDIGVYPNVKISEDEKYLIFSSIYEAKIWSFEYMKDVDKFDIDTLSLDTTKDNKYFVYIHQNDLSVELWNLEDKRSITIIDFSEHDMHFVKFAADEKSIIVYNEYQAIIHSIEKYFDSSRIDSDPFFILGEHDRVLRQKFINWVKNPSEARWEKEFLGIIVYPIGYNVLHYLCINDRADLLSVALNDEGEIFRDKQNMSPLSYALVRSSRRCIDKILNYVVDLEDDKKLFYCIHQIREDIPLLFNSKSISLVPFLEVLFRRRADKDHIGFYEVTEELPMSIFSPVYKIYISAFTGENGIEKKETSKQNESLIQFWGSPWGYNYTAGSDESLFLLKKIDECDNQDIFQTLFVQSIIREKWDYLWPAIITISVIYWLNLISMMWYMFYPNIYILGSFAALNGILAIYEFLQFITKPKDYVSEIWNLIDCIRMGLSIIWAILQFYDENIEELSFAVVLLNFVRGLTYFRAFDLTRFYVRLILMALTDSFAFLIIFLYSTLAFGVLYASLNANLSFSDMWAMAYELNMGNFDNGGFSFLQYSCFTLATLINVVMMLNLLVSTLGDTFDKFQMITEELDSKEMLQLVVEFESLMFWARSEQAKLRNKDKIMYLQRCDAFQDSDVPDKWQGKIKEISLKIDGVKDDVLGGKKSVSEELKRLEENIKSQEKSMNEKIEKMKEEINSKIESKMNGIMEILEIVKAKLEEA